MRQRILFSLLPLGSPVSLFMSQLGGALICYKSVDFGVFGVKV